jgi:hypothetical protein
MVIKYLRYAKRILAEKRAVEKYQCEPRMGF